MLLCSSIECVRVGVLGRGVLCRKFRYAPAVICYASKLIEILDVNEGIPATQLSSLRESLNLSSVRKVGVCDCRAVCVYVNPPPTSSGMCGPVFINLDRHIMSPQLISTANFITARVFRSDSPVEAAQWLARSIRES
jgi:hypothetical protein